MCRIEGAKAWFYQQNVLNVTEPISSEVAQRFVDPALFMGNEHQTNHAQDRLFVCHVRNIGHDAIPLLPSKPYILEVTIEFPDDLCAMLCKPISAFIFRKLGVEHSFTPPVATLWIGSPSSERTVKIPPVSLAYVPSHCESGTPDTATIKSFPLEEVCASFATMTYEAKSKPSNGMR